MQDFMRKGRWQRGAIRRMVAHVTIMLMPRHRKTGGADAAPQ
jgi:hypothetical protein